MSVSTLIGLIQVFFAVVIGLYFWNLLKNQQSSRATIDRDSKREMEHLRTLRAVSLSEPLSERTRPSTFDDIIGQEMGIRALRAALCGPNPQHVIIYGTPGVGKTAAARLVLEEAKRSPLSPFRQDAKFIEVDATTARFDERGIADPVIGSVHDPIYQGAGAMGVAGIPQPKPGAVTKAHGGVLFIDEIGELHPIQLNKLLKVLEDRRVFLESAYYSPEDTNIPAHIHDIFQNGLPADFRLVGATTRLPSEIPPAIRSRCLEIYFRTLLPEEIGTITRGAAAKLHCELSAGAEDVIRRHAHNGREAVNYIQIAAGIAMTEGRQAITQEDAEWVMLNCQATPRLEKRIPNVPQIGVVNGLAVSGPNMGMLLEVEAIARYAGAGKGRLQVTGIVEEEEMGGRDHTVRRKSMAHSSAQNVLTLLRSFSDTAPDDYDIHVNFPGGTPIDGPSAGLTMVTAIYSALTRRPVDHRIAMTGEVSIRGWVRPVGGVVAKVQAAKQAGATRVIIPRENWQEMFSSDMGVEVIPVAHVEEAWDHIFGERDLEAPQGATDAALQSPRRAALSGTEHAG